MSARRRFFDAAAIVLIILCLLGAAAPDFYRVRDVRAHRDLMRDINDAEQAYSAAHPRLGYACSLGELADEGLIDLDRVFARFDKDRTSGQTDSYAFRLGCRGRRVFHRAYYLYAEPRRADRPWLCSDNSGILASDHDSLMGCYNSLQNQPTPAPSPFSQPFDPSLRH